MLSSCNCSNFGYAGELNNCIDCVVLCDKCYKKLSQNDKMEMCADCYGFDFLQIHYITKPKFYPEDLHNCE